MWYWYIYIYIYIYICYILPGHKDSVTCVAISPDSVYAATGDLAGMIQVWDLQQLKLIWSFEVSDLEVNINLVKTRFQILRLVKMVKMRFQILRWV